MTVELLKEGGKVLSESPMVIKNPKDQTHFHTYGGLSQFFEGLTKGKLLGTKCGDSACEENRIWLPPRPYCPDCLKKTEYVKVPPRGKIYSFSTVLYPGKPFRLSIPCPLISVEIEGVCTKLMSYLKEGKPKIGLPVRAVFNTEKPTYTILDLAWVP